MTARRLLLALALALSCAPAHAVKLDDSLSPRQRISGQLQWTTDLTVKRHLDATEMNALHTRVPAVEVRLNTAAYVGRTVQIYLGMPLQVQGLRTPGAMRIEWQTRGQFTSGSTIPGARSLIFQGVVPAAVMGDFFDFTIYVDGRYAERELQFDPQFELETLR